MVSQALGYWVAGRFDQAETIARSLHEMAVARRTDDARGAWSLALGRTALSRGKPQTAARWLREGAALLRVDDIGRFLPWCLGALAQALALLGEVDQAAAASAEAEAVRSPAIALYEVDVELGRAWVRAAQGERSNGRRIALDAAQRADGLGQAVGASLAYYDAARLGATAEAAAPLRALVDRVDGPLVGAMADHVGGVLARDAEQIASAAATFEAAGALLHAAEAHADHATILDGPARTAALATAATLARSCEGARTPSLLVLEAGDPLAALSDREREVAVLAASGLSSRDIAARLFVSTRTVDNHLQRVYVKLGVSGRRALAPLMAPGPTRLED
jgi:ATP/maltotriose-dependent transcriptional regulator MalT